MLIDPSTQSLRPGRDEVHGPNAYTASFGPRPQYSTRARMVPGMFWIFCSATSE